MIKFVIELQQDNEEICFAALVCTVPGCGWRRDWTSSDPDMTLHYLLETSTVHEENSHGRT